MILASPRVLALLSCLFVALAVAAAPARADQQERLVAPGIGQACGVTTAGTVSCWGYEPYNEGETRPPADLGQATSVAANESVSCAVVVGGEVRCWGAPRRAGPTGLSPARAVAITGSAACVIRLDATLKCVDSTPPAGRYVQLSVGRGTLCALREDSVVVCWGSFAAPGDLGPARSVAVGDEFACAVQIDGVPRCWGPRFAYDPENDLPPALREPVRSLSSNWDASCVVRADFSPACWGPGAAVSETARPRGIFTGGFGTCIFAVDGSTACGGVAAAPADVRTPPEVDAGAIHTCAIRSDSTAVCWGDPGDGRTAVPDDLGPVDQISAGRAHSCAVRVTDGEARCWGLNDDGQATVPADLGPVLKVEAGGDHTCAVRVDGLLRCWGANAAGQRAVPGDLGRVLDVVAGNEHTCALTTDHTVACWGAAAPSTVPTNPALGKALSISGGGFTTCAVQLATSKTVCWGSVPLLGAFPTPANPPEARSASVGGLNGCAITVATSTAACFGPIAPPTPPTDTLQSLSSGAGHTCAVKITRGLVCWGSDADGQLRGRITSTPPAWIGTSGIDVRLRGVGGGRHGVTAGALPTGVRLQEDGRLVGGPTQHAETATFTVSPSTDALPPADPSTFTIGVDLVKPSTTDDVPTTFSTAKVSVTLAATDDLSGIRTTTYEIVDTGGNAGPTTTYDPARRPVLDDGERLRYRSIDNAGNVEATRTSAPAQVDAVVPTAVITTAPAISGPERSPLVAFTGDGVGATYACSLDDAPFAACTSPLSLGPLADGPHTFRVRATSRAGVTGPVASAAFTVVQPTAVQTPAASAPAAAPTPSLTLLGDGRGRQILLNKRFVSVRVSCGATPCVLQLDGVLRVKSRTRVTLSRQAVTLAAGESKILRIPTTVAQRRIIRGLLGRRGTGGQARFTLTATNEGVTRKVVVSIGLRRLASG